MIDREKFEELIDMLHDGLSMKKPRTCLCYCHKKLFENCKEETEIKKGDTFDHSQTVELFEA